MARYVRIMKKVGMSEQIKSLTITKIVYPYAALLRKKNVYVL